MHMYYFAVTYDVCEHQSLCEDMNQYEIDLSEDLEKQLKQFAKQDVAPLVRIYESRTTDCSKPRLVKEYYFEEYKCHCEEYANRKGGHTNYF